MPTDDTSRVSLADGLAVVEQLRDLQARCVHNGQLLFATVFGMTCDALAESLSNADDMLGDDQDDGGC